MDKFPIEDFEICDDFECDCKKALYGASTFHLQINEHKFYGMHQAVIEKWCILVSIAELSEYMSAVNLKVIPNRLVLELKNASNTQENFYIEIVKIAREIVEELCCEVK